MKTENNITTDCYFFAVTPEAVEDDKLTESYSRTMIAFCNEKSGAEKILSHMYEVHTKQGNRTKPEDFNCVEVLLDDVELKELFDLGVLSDDMVENIKQNVKEGKQIVFDSWWI